jgi:hypothetical protein
VGNRMHDSELAQLDHELTTLRRRLARAFLYGDTAEITRTRAEITELEGCRTPTARSALRSRGEGPE